MTSLQRKASVENFKPKTSHLTRSSFWHIWMLCLLLLSITANAQEQRADSAIVSYLESEYRVRFSDNNSIVLFKNGQEKFDDLFTAVRQAKSTIHLEYFNFRNDSISALLFDLLAERVKAGVKVRALFDGFGNSSNNRPLKKHHIDTLRQRGIEIYEYDKLRFPWINHALYRDHRKIVVIDGVVAYTGGMNVADYYIIGKPEFGDWRDIHARVEGDAVAELQKAFLDFWNEVTNQDVKGPDLYPGYRTSNGLFTGLKTDTTATKYRKHVGFVDRVPNETPDIIRNTFVNCIENAHHSIYIINPYFTLNKAIKRALKKALKRGVKVHIMISDKSDIPITPRIVDHQAHRLMKRGADVYVYTGGFHHSKIMMIDEQVSFIGSANLNSRSLRYDYECNLLIDDSCTTKELLHIFNVDTQTRCYKLTPETWKKKSKWHRFQSWFFQILTPFV